MIKKIEVTQNYILEFVERAISHNLIIMEEFDDLFSGSSYVDGIRVYEGYKIELDFKEDTPLEILEKEYICYDVTFPNMGRQSQRSQIIVLKIKEIDDKEKIMTKIDVLDELERLTNKAVEEGKSEDRVRDYGNLYVYIDDKTPFFNIAADVSVGGLEYKSGVAHFAEHMLSANPSEVDIFVRNNIFNNASTSILDTRYYLDQTGALLTNIPENKEDVDESYGKLSKEINDYIDEFFYWWKLIKKYYLKTISKEELDILTKEFERHKSVIKEEINMDNKKLRNDMKNQLAYYSNIKLPEWYNGVLGLSEDLDNITLDDIAEFYSRYYKLNSVNIAFSIPKSIVVYHNEFYKKYLEPKLKTLKEDILVDNKFRILPKDSLYYINYKEDYDKNIDTLEIEYSEHSRVNFAMKTPDPKTFSEKAGVPERFVLELGVTLENTIYDQVTSRLRKDGLIYGLFFWKNRNLGLNTGANRLQLMCYTNNHDETIEKTMGVLKDLEMTLENIITDDRYVLKSALENNINKSFKQFTDMYDRKEFDRYFKGVNYPDYFYETFYIMNAAMNGKYDITRYEEIVDMYLKEFKNNLDKIHILKCIPKNEE